MAILLDAVKILVTGTNTTLDNGEFAISSSAIREMAKLIPSAVFSVGSTQPFIDSKRWRDALRGDVACLRLISGITTPRVSRSIRSVSLVIRYIPACLGADLCLDISGDGYSDLTEGGIVSTLTHSTQLLIAIFQRKKVAVFSQSIGPFFHTLSKLIAKLVLNKTDLIIVREPITFEYLRRLGIRKSKLVMAADAAFLLPSIPKHVAESIIAKESGKISEKPLIGIVTSQIIYKWMFPNCKDLGKKYNLYTESMAKIVDHVVEKFNSNVLLISQCIGRYARHDDRIAAEEVFRKVNRKERVIVVHGMYSPQEIKGLIGCCELVISAKMHSAIAAATMGIPLVVLSYSSKTLGIFGGRLGSPELVVYAGNSKPEELFTEIVSRVDSVWRDRKAISRKLSAKSAEEKKQALRGIFLVVNLLSNVKIHARRDPCDS